MDNKILKLFNISNKVVVITGASGFFGKYISRFFLEFGAKIIIMGRSNKINTRIHKLKKEFGDNMVYGYQVDFYNHKVLKKTLYEISEKFDIDVLINNAYDLSEKTGFNTINGHLENSDHDQWISAFESGIYWAVLTTQIIGKQFKKNKKGNIINIGSMYGVVSPNPKLYEGTNFFNPPSYSINKSGIIALTKYTASFWGKDGIRCNTISPGAFPNIEEKKPNSVDSDDSFIESLKSNTILNRVGHPNDLKGILLYLSSDASSYMTGQNLIIDGGWTTT